ncbi:unnamed protein product [Cylicocyclus nassatus]|uniref:Uncharacterized protein n=1 Tax=Cylicocyclus nassatus TaxID=53992 RepID=A0AA36GTZ4_CYLNA|nr:unnamed protein product [Cylicocyclus nassatus]
MMNLPFLLLIAILSLSTAAPTFNISEAIILTKIYMESDESLKEMSKEERAFVKVAWFLAELLGEGFDHDFNKNDAAVVGEVFLTTRPRSDEAFVAELTKKSPDLGARFKNMIDSQKKHLAMLKPEGQAFVKDIKDFVWNKSEETAKHL